MLSCENYIAEIEKIEKEIHELGLRKKYREIELFGATINGCANSENTNKLYMDPKFNEFVYRIDQLQHKLNFVKSMGYLPPDI